ncbi:MAG: UDP-glucose--hexose-1-phosphate uridylyltransferase [Filifactoraceae bacterium]
MEIYKNISALVNYSIKNNLLESGDRVYVINRLLDLLGLEEYKEYNVEINAKYTSELLEPIIEYALAEGIIKVNTTTYRDIFDAKIMDILMDRPTSVISKFQRNFDISPRLATDEYYRMSVNSNYIRKDRTDKNIIYKVDTEYGNMDITINISKPEKDPKDIAFSRNKKSNYPSCLLCVENEGYSGTVSHPARGNHRIIPIELDGREWFFQYSPYVYYNEHCIIFDKNHVSMVISGETFNLMMDFVSKFKHYFVGSNSDLPIVGGSILNHNHFQGGSYNFPMAEALSEKKYEKWEVLGVKVERIKWPMSVIRITGKDYKSVAVCSTKIFEAWKCYNDESVGIISCTGGVRHNTITPIARYRNGFYECDVVLRNNRTDDEHPTGIFHLREELHHIKKENIGLIEVMGLAVLPGRLVGELEFCKDYILTGNKDNINNFKIHLPWVENMKNKYQFTKENIDEIFKLEIGRKFAEGLEDCGVFKRDNSGMKAFDRFVESL